MNKIEAIVRASNSKDVHKLNPHLFGSPKFSEFPEALKPEPKQKKRIRQSSRPLMNKLEEDFLRHLAVFAGPFLLTHPKLSDPRPQAIKLRLANGVFYKPDFFSFSWLDGRPTAWEVKELRGKNVDRGKLALKVAASAWPEIRFYLVWREDGKWCEQEVLP